MTARVTRWRLGWLTVPAAAGLVWMLTMGPGRAAADFAAGPQILGYLGRAGWRPGSPPVGGVRGAGRWLPGQLPVALIAGPPRPRCRLARWRRAAHQRFRRDVPACGCASRTALTGG